MISARSATNARSTTFASASHGLRRSWLGASLLASFFLLHCSAATEGPQDEHVASTAKEGQTFEQFKSGLQQVEPGTYRVEGDMLVAESSLKDFYADTHENPQALTVKAINGTRQVWSPASRFEIKYCVSNNFGNKQAMVADAMQKATRGWQTEAGAGLAFRYVNDQNWNCTLDNPNVNIAVVFEENLPDAFGDAWVGPQRDAKGREYNRIRLSPAAFNAWQLQVGSFGILDLASVAAHELGHALGFYHEHDNPNAGGCASNPDPFFDGTHQQLTPYDPPSVMHYRSIQKDGCTSSTYVWLTKSDRDGARIAYPPTATTPAPQPQCLKGSYGRNAGTIPAGCGAGQEKDGALCYPACRPGYHGVGPVCWQNCPAGYTDDGVTCRLDASIIGADNGSCPWYDKCGLATAKGCSVCPDGYHNDGCTCRRDANIFAKDSYGRGAGTTLSCDAPRELDGGLCYMPCSAGYKGVGPVCYEQCQ